MINISKYNVELQNAISFFWDKRNEQKKTQATDGKKDQGNRGEVTAGKQLDGFLHLLKVAAIDIGVPEESIYTKGNHLLGFFRPTKNWDFLIITPSNKLISVIELKSQVGSFGNNFNNRTEEALGSALDFWTAYRENVYPDQQVPWLGYLMVVEDSSTSKRPVRIQKSRFEIFDEFKNTSYLQRYQLFCKKLMLERHYSASCLIQTTKEKKYSSE
ncbi:MAG: PaeR7I family type II restriction endonuclease [Cyanobacteria bacterium J06649_11]